jgi:hypothetical protein
MKRSGKPHSVSGMRSVSSAGGSIRPMTTVVVNELTREYSDVLAAETIKACARAAIRDLRGSIHPEAVPEMAGRLAQGSGAACGDGRQFRRARRLQRGTTRRKPGPLLSDAHTSIIGTASCGISPVVAPPPRQDEPARRDEMLARRSQPRPAISSRSADEVSTTGQIRNQMTGVRAPVRAVSMASAKSSPAEHR